MDLNYVKKKSFPLIRFAFIGFTFLVFISTIEGYDSLLKSYENMKSKSPNDYSYWNNWKIITIIYLVIIDIITFVGFYSALYDNYKLAFFYAVSMVILFGFGFANSVLRSHIFGLIVKPPASAMALIFSYKIRKQQLINQTFRKDMNQNVNQHNSIPNIWTTEVDTEPIVTT